MSSEMTEYKPSDSVPVVAHNIGVAQGRELERKWILAWLRCHRGRRALALADAIEAGEHLK